MTGIAHIRALLRDAGRIDGRSGLTLAAGGVSSTVVTVTGPDGAWVAKSPLRRLAVADDWYADPARNLREAAVLELLAGRVGPLRTPRLRFCDAGRLVIGMELIGPPAPSWKEELLAGRVDRSVGDLVGRAAGALHRLRPAPALGLAGPAAARLYEELRVDPYYRTAARRAPRFAGPLARLIEATTDPGLARALVHADLNPKNVLVASDGPVLIDWELAHVGDPALDLAMPVAHLILKALRPARLARAPVPGDLIDTARVLWAAYSGPARRDLAVRHVGGIMVARLWGKSPVDYLDGPAERAAAERVAGVALSGAADLEEVLDAVASCVTSPG